MLFKEEIEMTPPSVLVFISVMSNMKYPKDTDGNILSGCRSAPIPVSSQYNSMQALVQLLSDDNGKDNVVSHGNALNSIGCVDGVDDTVDVVNEQKVYTVVL